MNQKKVLLLLKISLGLYLLSTSLLIYTKDYKDIVLPTASLLIAAIVWKLFLRPNKKNPSLKKSKVKNWNILPLLGLLPFLLGMEIVIDKFDVINFGSHLKTWAQVCSDLPKIIGIALIVFAFAVFLIRKKLMLPNVKSF